MLEAEWKYSDGAGWCNDWHPRWYRVASGQLTRKNLNCYSPTIKSDGKRYFAKSRKGKSLHKNVIDADTPYNMKQSSECMWNMENKRAQAVAI